MPDSDWEDVPAAAPAGDWENVPMGEVQPAKPPDVSRAAALGRGAAQGATLGFGDEISGAIQAVTQKYPFLSPLQVAAHLSTGRPLSELAQQYEDNAGKSLGDLYRENRDAFRAENEAAKKAHPGYYVGGEVGGAALTAPATVLLTGPEAGPIVAGAEMGGVGGLGGSSVELSKDVTPEKLAEAGKDVAVGTVLGAVVGALGKAAAGVPARLRQLGINMGRRAIAGTRTLSAASKKSLEPEAIEEAVNSGAITPGASTHQVEARLEDLTAEQGQKLGDIMDALEKRGVTGSDKTELGLKLLKEVEGLTWAEHGENPKASEFERVAQLLADTKTTGGDKLGLKQQEEIKQLLQQAARKEYAKLHGFESPEGLAKMQAASRVRQATEDEIAAQAHKAPEEAAAFVPAKEKYGRLARALGAARVGANKEAGHAALDLPETLTLLGEAATGEPAAALRGLGAAVGHHILKGRLPSTVAYGGIKGAQALRALGKVLPSATNATRALAPAVGQEGAQ